MKTVATRLITDDERYLAEGFQELIKITMESAVFAKNTKSSSASIADYKKLRKSIKRFQNYPFITNINSTIAKMDKQIIDTYKGKIGSKSKTSELVTKTNELEAMFRSGDVTNAGQLTTDVLEMSKVLAKGQANPSSNLENFRNPYFIENPLFFGRNGLLTQFTTEDMEALLEKDLSIFCYTYMPLPESRTVDYEFIVHWIQELKENGGDVEISANEYAKYAQFAYSPHEFDALKNMVDRYLSNNEKYLIPQIIEGINKIPDLKKTNDDCKQHITTVYRGISYDRDETEFKDIVPMDRKQQYVATSLNFRAAKRFAYQIGHLESEDSRRSDRAVIITYKVSPEAIIMDTRIFGGKFGESEILIDATKAKVDDIQTV